MPLTLRPQELILDVLLSSLLAGDVATDINPIGVLRQLCEGMASTQADLEYDLFTLARTFYITTAEGLDLDIRGTDYGLARDPGQAASDAVTFYALPTYIEDIPLPAQQVVQATLLDGTVGLDGTVLLDGTVVLYRSLGALTLTPSGRSVSGQAPATSLASGVNDQVRLNLDGDGARTVLLGTQTTAVGIASALQAAVRALVALNPSHQSAYNTFRCDYGVTTPGAYTLRSGTPGPTSSCVVTPAASADASGVLKLGLAHGGLESVGQATLAVPVRCDTIGILGNVGAGQINQQATALPGIDHVANALMFSNGREPASDDAYRQDIRSYLLSLGRGTEDAIERAVAHTVSPVDGQMHVLSSQVVYGTGTILVYVCDGRSLTVGAQSDVIEAVQDELDGLGQEPGGWIPGGNTAGVASASVTTVTIDVTVVVGPTPDLVSAQTAITQALYTLLYQSGIGQGLTYMQAAVTIDQTVVEVLDVQFRMPLAWGTTPPSIIGGTVGVKLMPGPIAVQVVRA
jgi:uncharacterized phage protein gp47/JayE